MLAGMLTSIPASLFMQRFGRRAGFLPSSTIDITGASLAAVAWFIIYRCNAVSAATHHPESTGAIPANSAQGR